jgi:hypothetical protein
MTLLFTAGLVGASTDAPTGAKVAAAEDSIVVVLLASLRGTRVRFTVTFDLPKERSTEITCCKLLGTPTNRIRFSGHKKQNNAFLCANRTGSTTVVGCVELIQAMRRLGTYYQ